ncbi:hypothetical protein T310_3107 [Rasamsonia emersonii CBS 393.64]|uniref:Uncharacterized protein n=1 Tax=Rasamsonia emersonii (strain ATCC 16479 / CBS 393.64 / IMI 116815) TaxID=1408163 RepID=A0A0F4YYD4_RASE3|nr:hypothetical protein T310_3107 [Rasamsonia emersonii CBS 393.64]KKA22851.1 hypothetical protein T310_3107 [Rasamsonia emersonii CBS 393.64]
MEESSSREQQPARRWACLVSGRRVTGQGGQEGGQGTPTACWGKASLSLQGHWEAALIEASRLTKATTTAIQQTYLDGWTMTARPASSPLTCCGHTRDFTSA